ncbi:11990_t:CDS:2 [Acaulospora morrowiae]|uniref:11990_t:CDS:1 n=1 Tax=Acaulospora morrowiae TaxID=94023 RepID=A0A9N9GEL4_9GLOM|nr:11990_t:CDS:2 [Acaulospora morrowiae]
MTLISDQYVELNSSTSHRSQNHYLISTPSTSSIMSDSSESINDLNVPHFSYGFSEEPNLDDYYHRYPSASFNSSTFMKKRYNKKQNTNSSCSSMKYPDFPIKAQCPSCKKFVTTQIHHKNGKCVYALAMGLFGLTVVLFWVPFFVDSCKDVSHSCPNCNVHLGTRHRL